MLTALLGAARRALVRAGEPRLEGPLLLVAADQVHASAASQATVSPVRRLAEILTQLGTPTTLLTYDRDELAATQAALLEKASHASGTVVFVSTARTRMGDDERSFAQAVAQRARGFVHLALWNPYHAKDLPGPALLTFGFREASLQAVAASWDEANATSPVKLELLPMT